MVTIKILIVDGYNTMDGFGIMKRVDRKEITLGEGRGRLVEILNTLNKKNRETVLVFDGIPMENWIRFNRIEIENLKVVFTEEESADDFIEKIADRNSIVITLDKELKRCLRKTETIVLPPEWLFVDRNSNKKRRILI